MSNFVDKIFNKVCLDERIKDGIFNLEEEEHMDALRDFFIKKGITKEESIGITNRMLEGRFPERQAYNKDGVLVTFPTPKHKQRALQRGTHFEKNPAPQPTSATQEPPQGPKKELPVPTQEPSVKDDKIEDVPKKDPEGGVTNKVFQGEKELDVEPPRGDEKPEPPPQPTSPVQPQAPRTPERISAEREVVKQILSTDDTALYPVDESLLSHQLNEMYKKCDEWGFQEMKRFLKPHIKQ